MIRPRSRPRYEPNAIAVFGQEQRGGRSDRPGSNYQVRVDEIPSYPARYRFSTRFRGSYAGRVRTLGSETEDRDRCLR
jgi:hypothetical protein